MPSSKDKSKIPKPKSFSRGIGRGTTTSPVENPTASGIPTPKSTGGSYRAKYSGLAKERLSGVSTKSELDNQNIKVVLPRQNVEVKEAQKGIRGRGSKIPTVHPLKCVGIAKLTDHDNASPIRRPCQAGGMKNPHIVHKVDSKELIAQNVCPSHRVYSKEKISQKEYQSQVEDKTEPVVPSFQEEEASKTKSWEFQHEFSAQFNLPNQDAEVKETPKEVRGRLTSRIPTIKPKMTDHDNIPPIMTCPGGEINIPHIVHKVDAKDKIEPVASTVEEEKASSDIQPELREKCKLTIIKREIRESSEVTAWMDEDYDLEKDCYIACDKGNLAGLNIVRMEDFRSKKVRKAYLVVDEDFEPLENQGDDYDTMSTRIDDLMTDFTMADNTSNCSSDIYERTPEEAETEIEQKLTPKDDDSFINAGTENQMNVKQVRISDVLGELENPNHNPIWEEEQDSYGQERIDDVEQPEEMDNVISDPKLDIKPNVHKNENIFVVENLEFIPTSHRKTSSAVNESREEEIAATFEEIEIKNENQDQDEIVSEKLCEEKKNNNPVPGKKSTLEVALREGNRTLDEIDSTLLKWGYFWTFILLLTGIGLLVLYLSNKLRWLDELCRQYMFEPEPPWYQSVYNWCKSIFTSR